MPFLSVLDELRTIEIGKDQVVMPFDNTGEHVERVIQMTDAHLPNVKPSLHGARHRPVGGRNARDRYDRFRAQFVGPRHERPVELG